MRIAIDDDRWFTVNAELRLIDRSGADRLIATNSTPSWPWMLDDHRLVYSDRSLQEWGSPSPAVWYVANADTLEVTKLGHLTRWPAWTLAGGRVLLSKEHYLNVGSVSLLPLE